MQKSLAFLYTNNEKQREIKETILLTTPSKRIKYLGINLPNEAKDLHSENCKILMKEIQDNTKREIPRSWMGRINYCENDYTMQSNLQIQQNPSQITKGIFHRIRTKKFTLCMETQKTSSSKSNIENEGQSRTGSLTSDHTTKLQELNSMVLEEQKQEYK